MGLLYELAVLLGLLLYVPRALLRRRLPHRGWTMRLGRYPRQVREALGGRRALWLHAVSVGEVLAVRPLARALLSADPQTPLALSTITPGGFQVAAAQLSPVVPIYFPLDLRACVTRALDTIRPRALLLVECEWWPTVIRLTKARGASVVVVNGRLSERAFRRYRRVAGWTRRLLQDVDCFLMQSEADARRVAELGASPGRIQVVGSLKWDSSVGTRPSPEVIGETAARLGLSRDHLVVVAGSTHRGEEDVVLDAFAQVRDFTPRARLILAPRHLERLGEVERLSREAGFETVRCSAASASTSWTVALVDTFGELARYYGLAHAVFIGGSLVRHGGQNPLEATSLGKAVVFGPHMENFAEIAQRLLEAEAARQLRRPEELAPVLRLLCASTGGTRMLGMRAQAVTERSQGAVVRTLAALRPFLRSPS